MLNMLQNPFAQPTHYIQLSFHLPQGAAEQAEDAFSGLALAFSAFEIDEPNQIWNCELLFIAEPDMAEIESRVALLAVAGGVKPPKITRQLIEQQDWLSLVARQFPPLSIGRFFVHGSHVEEAPPTGAIAIQVEAGAAFGSGEHGTTRCCLEALEHVARLVSPRTVLDMGTGSGILAIAAAKLWNADILAVDIDPVSVQVAQDNAAINRAIMRCCVSDGYKGAEVQRFGACDLIIANILARPLVMFAPSLARQLKPGGYAILSGLLVEQETMVRTAHRMQGLKLIRRFTHEGWCTLLLQK